MFTNQIMKSKNKSLRIIKAAAKIFARDGLERARVEDIAEEACIGKGTIYLYFPDKETILEEGIRYFAEERISQLSQLLVRYSSPKKKLITLLNLSIRISEKSPDLFFMNYAALLSTHKDLRQRAVSEFFEQYLGFVEEVIKKGIGRGEFRKVNPKVAALAIVLTQDVGNLLFLKKESKVKSETIAKELVKMIGN
jgi:AcrR family transcriptional regulator